MKIEINKLKRVTEELFKYMEENDIKEVDFDKDYYWSISNDQLFDTSKDPSDFTVGQLTDDYQEIVKDLNDEVSGHTMYHLAPIISYLSKKVI